ncbi:MAG: CDP-alcohol phosphatidyltransferase family protein [Spirochaetia bacterium]
MNTALTEKFSKADRMRAWAVHIFTAAGALAGLNALVHILRGDVTGVLIWLVIALVIDAADGPLARRYRVDTVLPHIDGIVLDHVIDFTTYALIPAIFLYEFGLVPEGWELATAGVVVVTSLYCFANKGLKTKDNFFSGFPAAWNLVVLGFYVLETPPIVNLALVPPIAILTFVPIKVIHPFRVRAYRPLTISFTFVWAALAFYLVMERRTSGNLIENNPPALWTFIAVSSYFIIISLIRTFRGRLGKG